MTDDRPADGEPQDGMAVTDRQWTYFVLGHFRKAEAGRLVKISAQARRLAQSRQPEGGTDDQVGQ